MNQPGLKFWPKLDLNDLLIGIFDPNLALESKSLQHNRFTCVWYQLTISKSIKNGSKSIEQWQNPLKKMIDFDFFDS